MQRRTRGKPTLTVVSVLLVVVVLFVPVTQAEERLRILINDVIEAPGEQGILEVSLANPLDEIVAIDLHLALSTYGIANFVVTEESGHYWIEIDTVGTLLSGCEWVRAQASTTGEMGLDLRLTATTQWMSTSENLMPQGGDVLFRVPVNLEPIPPPLHGYRVDVWIDLSWKQWFSFVTPEAEAIGWITVPMPDTNYYMCVMPEPPPGTGCFEWIKVFQWECPDGVCDSVVIDTNYVPVIDETQVTLDHGSITMRTWICGDVNGDTNVTIGDVSLLIDHLFINNPPIDPIEAGNVNCSDEQPVVLTIGDISALIDHLFISREPLCCDEL